MNLFVIQNIRLFDFMKSKINDLMGACWLILRHKQEQKRY
jgi:hypothetical protein